MHLFVICTDPCGEGKQALVPISKRVNNLCDGTCVLQAREHRFLQVESFVLYRKARIELQAALVAGVNKGLLIPDDDMNGQTFLRIINGICTSLQTPRKIKRYVGCA